MNITITDIAGTSGTTTVERDQVGDTLRTWFICTFPEVDEAINRIQDSLDRTGTTTVGDGEVSMSSLCTYLGVALA